jgi:hypothetical protein
VKTYEVTTPENFEGSAKVYEIKADSYEVLYDTKVLEFYVEDEDTGEDFSVATFAAGHWGNVLEKR